MKIDEPVEIVSMPRTGFRLWERTINNTPYQFIASEACIIVTNLETLKQVHTFKR